MSESQEKMILDWMRKIHQLEYAHRYESLMWSKRQTVIGYLAFGLSLLIAFSFRFPSIEQTTYDNLFFVFKHDFFVAFTSLVVALLTGYLTFTKPSEKAVLHKNTGSNYEKLRHRIELILTMEYQEWEFKKRTELIKDEWESLDAINVSPKFFVKGSKEVKSMNKYPERLGFLPDIQE
ncbi:SLATT domain-containing protein [uncultured Winogradskyella sp.]|uniref:SLATT domain-containing protein n=1 Tax=uncultured Winogradskyella sp. TaxID=395353 RepID=UPI0030EE3E1F|tara:strand:+ start:108 stop:641 length:534 start_codon:yes stop_codon:yes gene_type:complete